MMHFIFLLLAPPCAALKLSSLPQDVDLVPPRFGGDRTTFNREACEAKFEHLSDEMRRMLDYPHLMCTETKFSESTNPISISKKGVVEYPSKHWETDPDPEHDRTHIIVEGPESSASHFIMKMIAESLGIERIKSDFVITAKANLYHISQPEGSGCILTKYVPVLDDFGCQNKKSTCDTSFVFKNLDRFLINVTSVVQKYRERGESIKVVQTVRDPDITMMANHKGHCPDEAKEIEDNEIAFRLMLEARAFPEVITICYEQMIEEGKPYISEQFYKAGFNNDMKNFPNIKNGNLRYTVGPRECTFSAKAYMQLCPDSPHTKELSKMGCTPQ